MEKKGVSVKRPNNLVQIESEKFWIKKSVVGAEHRPSDLSLLINITNLIQKS